MKGINEITEAPTHHDDTSLDVILRSTNNIDFRTSKELLSKSSELSQTPCFRYISPLLLKAMTENLKDGLAVIHRHRRHVIVELLFCNRAPKMVRLDGVQRVATKYQMNQVAKGILRERLQGK